MLIEKYASEIQAIFAKYPSDQKRAAVMPLLYLAQRETGYLTQEVLREISTLCGIESTEVASIVGFYSLYYDRPSGKYRIQVCTDLPCALRGADQFLDELCQNLAIKVGETTQDGLVTIEEVTCLAGCNKAPMFQVQTGDRLVYHENQTVESALKLVDAWRANAERAPKEAAGWSASAFPPQGDVEK